VGGSVGTDRLHRAAAHGDVDGWSTQGIRAHGDPLTVNVGAPRQHPVALGGRSAGQGRPVERNESQLPRFLQDALHVLQVCRQAGQLHTDEAPVAALNRLDDGLRDAEAAIDPALDNLPRGLHGLVVQRLAGRRHGLQEDACTTL
jgi:hypothetical protein